MTILSQCWVTTPPNESSTRGDQSHSVFSVVGDTALWLIPIVEYHWPNRSQLLKNKILSKPQLGGCFNPLKILKWLGMILSKKWKVKKTFSSYHKPGKFGLWLVLTMYQASIWVRNFEPFNGAPSDPLGGKMPRLPGQVRLGSFVGLWVFLVRRLGSANMKQYPHNFKRIDIWTLRTFWDLDTAEKARREEEVQKWRRTMYVGRREYVCVFKSSEWVSAVRKEKVIDGLKAGIKWVCEWVRAWVPDCVSAWVHDWPWPYDNTHSPKPVT